MHQVDALRTFSDQSSLSRKRDKSIDSPHQTFSSVEALAGLASPSPAGNETTATSVCLVKSAIFSREHNVTETKEEIFKVVISTSS